MISDSGQRWDGLPRWRAVATDLPLTSAFLRDVTDPWASGRFKMEVRPWGVPEQGGVEAEEKVCFLDE